MPGISPQVLVRESVGYYHGQVENIERRRAALSRDEFRSAHKELQEEMQGEFWKHRDVLDSIQFKLILESIYGRSDAREIWMDVQEGEDLSAIFMEDEVSTKTFSNITGQIAYTAIREQFELAENIGPNLVTFSTTNYLDGEKIPGISLPADDFEIVGEAKPYPFVGISEEWIETPPPTKRGAIIPVTREAIRFNLLGGVLLRRVRALGTMMALNREKRILRTVLGLDASYKRNGTSIATYANNSGAHDWDNEIASNALQNWTDVENVWLHFINVNDPNIGEPIRVGGVDLIVPPALAMTADNIKNATEIRLGDGAGTTYQTISNNPLRGSGVLGYSRVNNVFTSPYVATLQGDSTTWYAGAFMKAFGYKSVWDVETTELPMDSAMARRDIAFALKTGEFGVAYVEEPRYVSRSRS